MQRAWSVILIGLMSLALLQTSCKKEGGSSAIAALLPKGAAAKLSSDLQVFAEELPGDVEAFGYLDFGKSLDELTKAGMGAEYRVLYDDFSAMLQRRWGVDASKVSGVGVLVHQRKPVFAFVAPAQDPKPGEDVGEVLIGKLGRLAVVGEPDVVLSVLASARQGKRLHQAKPMWLRNALVHAGGAFAFLSGNVEAFLATAPQRAQAQLADLNDGTVTIGAEGLGVYLSCKPGRTETVKGLIEAGLGMAKGSVAMFENQLKQREPGPLAAVVLHHYSQAFFKSLEQKVSGDEVSLTLGWHLPTLPKLQAASLADRVVVPGEIGFAQVNLGSPLLETLIAVTDFLKSPLDRAALHKELSAELAKLTGVPGFDPRAVTLSASAQQFFLSLHNAPLGQPGSTLQVPADVVAAVATKWGVAVAMREQRDALTAAVTTPPQGLAVDSKILGDDKAAMLRGSVDLTKLPINLGIPVVEMMHAMTVSVGDQEMLAEVITGKGQGKTFADELIKLAVKYDTDYEPTTYAERAKGSAEMEAMAIVQHYQHQQVMKFLQPESIEDDRVRFRMKYNTSGQMRVMTVAAVVGITAAVAVPAFIAYQARAEMMKVMQQGQDAATQDLDSLPLGADDAPDGVAPAGAN